MIARGIDFEFVHFFLTVFDLIEYSHIMIYRGCTWMYRDVYQMFRGYISKYVLRLCKDFMCRVYLYMNISGYIRDIQGAIGIFCVVSKNASMLETRTGNHTLDGRPRREKSFF